MKESFKSWLPYHGGRVLLLDHLVHGVAVLAPEVEALRLQPRGALQPTLHQLRQARLLLGPRDGLHGRGVVAEHRAIPLVEAHALFLRRAKELPSLRVVSALEGNSLLYSVRSKIPITRCSSFPTL